MEMYNFYLVYYIVERSLMKLSTLDRNAKETDELFCLRNNVTIRCCSFKKSLEGLYQIMGPKQNEIYIKIIFFVKA